VRRLFVLLSGLLMLVFASPALAAKTPLAKLRTTLSRELRSAHGASGAYVLDLNTNAALFDVAGGTPRLPASVEKLYTTTTALARFGADASLTTSVLAVGSVSSSGAFTGTLYLKGGGDPTFGSAAFDNSYYGTGATMQRLVGNLIRSSGIRSVRGAIEGDESYLDSRRGTIATGFAASSYLEGELSALAYDRGLQGSGFQRRPALYAAQQFAAALRSSGVNVPRTIRTGTRHAPSGARLLATVHSPSVANLAQLTNTPSDNFAAEMLLKDIGAAFGGAGTTAAGAAVVLRQLAATFGIHPRLDDGSGLSRDDRTSPLDVVTLLRAMAANRPFVRSLAIAGQSGTMRYEMVGTRAQGRCRGKTGSLHDVANLVGYCTARDGHVLAFAFLLNALSDSAAGHAIEDRMGEALANYNG
jgi:D-alanyl-D-alanine carboxypeptidase/D-alanyl-D-alanine-endopeptidase (penicillin-binding protein 4)